MYFAIKLSSTFGLRIEETARLRPSQIKGGYLQIKGKGGKVRNIRIETAEEKRTIEELKEYIRAKCKGKNDYILSINAMIIRIISSTNSPIKRKLISIPGAISITRNNAS